MNAPEVAAEIRADAFAKGARNVVSPPSLAAAARVLAAGLSERLDKILASKPWYWRLLFGRGLKFAVDVLESVASQIAGDYSMS